MTRKILFLLVLLASCAFPQAVRFDGISSTTNSQCAPGATCPLMVIPGTQVNFCSGQGLGTVSANGNVVTLLSGPSFTGASGKIQIGPNTYQIQTVISTSILTITTSAGVQASAVYSTLAGCLSAPATAYSSADTGMSCPTTAQITPSTGGPCVSTADKQGNYGAWFLPGLYYYYLRTPASAGGVVSGPYPISIGASAGCPSGVTCDANYATFALACAAAGSGTLYVSLAWNGLPTQTVSCGLSFISSGKLQPGSGQVLTLTNSYLSCPPSRQCLDASIGGAASISIAPNVFPSVAGPWFGSSIGTTSGSADTIFAPLTAAMDSLPVAGPSPGGTVYQGLVTLNGTGVQTNRYNLAQTFIMSPRVHIAGSQPTATYIGIPTGGFTGSSLFSVFSATGSYPADNFNTGISDIFFDAFTNSGSAAPGCINWGVSVGSVLERIWCETKGIGVLIGGTANTPDSDGVAGNNLTFLLQGNASNLMTAQAMVWLPGGNAINTQIYSQIKVAAAPLTTDYACQGVPALDLGFSNWNIQLIGVQIENHPCPVVIGDTTFGAILQQISITPDCRGACDQSHYPYGILIDPASANIKVSGIFTVYKNGVVLGHFWRSSTPVAFDYEIIDPLGHVQQVSTAGMNGSTQPTWNDSGGTTTTGTATYTDRGALATVCGASANGLVTLPCAMPTIAVSNKGIQSLTGPVGASSGTDMGFYSFNYDSNEFWTSIANVLPGGASPGTSQTTILSGPNFSPMDNETGANNAIAITWIRPDTNANVVPIPGTVISIVLSHSLQAGANTLAINGGSAVPIKSHNNPANNIATAYVPTTTIELEFNYNGTIWLDKSQ